MMQQITLGGAMIALPLFLQMTLEYNAMEAGLSLAPLSLSMFGVALLAGKRAGKRRPADIVLVGFALTTIGIASIIPIDAPRRIRLGSARPAPDHGLGAGPVGVAAQQLHAVTHRGGAVSEAAGVNSAAGSFGLSFGLAMAGGLMLAILSFSFTHMVENSTVIPPAPAAADRDRRSRTTPR